MTQNMVLLNVSCPLEKNVCSVVVSSSLSMFIGSHVQ